MNMQEFTDIMNWMGKRINELKVDDQLRVFAAVYKMVQEVKPIYERDIKQDTDEFKSVTVWLKKMFESEDGEAK